MPEEQYTISEVSKLLRIEQNNLRTMERQLELPIPRNEGNRRYYRSEEVQLLKEIQTLRGEGFQLRMIKLLLPRLPEIMQLESSERRRLRQQMKRILSDSAETEELQETGERQEEECQEEDRQELQEERSCTLKPLKEENPEISAGYAKFSAAMTELMKSNNRALLEEMDERIANRIMKEMNYLFRERENIEEERYRKLDRTIREHQAARRQLTLGSERERAVFWKRD